MSDVRHNWAIAMLLLAATFLIAAAAEWYTVPRMSAGHWMVFWLLLAGAAGCLVALLLIWRWGRWPIAWVVRSKDPLMLALAKTVKVSDKRRKLADQVLSQAGQGRAIQAPR